MIDFVGIGINKAATSWIHTCLGEHPGLCISYPKETHFFGKHYKKGLDWYKTCFHECTSETLKGEYSPEYLQEAHTPERIKTINPKAKLIVCLRNPIERITSAFFFNKSLGKHTYKTLQEKIDTDPGDDLHKGLYAQHINRYLEHFPREQLLILIYEDIAHDPIVFIQNIYRFLDVDDSFIPPSGTRKVNVTGSHRFYFLWINKILLGTRRKLKRTPLGKYLITFFKLLGLNKIVKYIIKKNRAPQRKQPQPKKPIDLKTRNYLQDYYKKDKQTLERILNRDLHFWQ